MVQKFTKSIASIMLMLLSLPLIAFAQSGFSYQIESPLAPSIFSIESLLTAVLNILLVIAVPIIVFFIIFAGFSYVTARGNPEKIQNATRSITYALIGAVLILGGIAISEIIKDIVCSFSDNPTACLFGSDSSITNVPPVLEDGTGSAGGG